MMKSFGLLAFLCAQFIFASSKLFSIKGPENIKNCDFKGYVPGGKVVEVKKIKAPMAELSKNGISSALVQASEATSLVGEAADLLATASKVFAKASPFLGPAIGVFGGVIGVLDTATSPTPADIVKAVNTAIGDLTKDMNDKIDDMKGYVDGQIIKTEKELIGRDYRSKFNLLVQCLSEPTKDLSNECQRDSYWIIGANLPKFAVFDTKLVSKKPSPLTTMEAKKLEAYLVPFRNYANLVLLNLVPLVKVYSKDTSSTGRGFYKKFSDELKTKAEFFIKYANAAVKAIEKMHNGTDHAGACPNSVECGPLKQHYEGAMWFEKNTYDDTECTCVIDDAIKQRCSFRAFIRVDDKRMYTTWSYPLTSNSDAMKRWAKYTLMKKYAKPFIKEQNKVIKEYWKKELLDFIPEWEKAKQIALPGTKVASDVEVSDDYSPRYKYRAQFARRYPNFLM